MTQPSSILITNARVLTADLLNPRAEAVAISGNRIQFVGSNADAESYRASAARIIDGQDCTLMPGIIDSHYHLLIGSTDLGHIQLDGVKSLEKLGESIRQHMESHPDQTSYSATRLQYDILPDGELLGRHHLDAIVPDRPLIIMAFDLHTVWANTPALEVADLLYGAQTGPNSEIVMDENGTATGELREPAAYGLLLTHFEAWARFAKGLAVGDPAKLRFDHVRERCLLQEGLKLAARFGITSIHNMDGDMEQAGIYAALEDTGELTLRVHVPYSITPQTSVQDLDEAGQMAQTFQGDMVSCKGVKFFMDGVTESWTAFLLDDYADRPGWKGDALFSAGHFNQMALESDRRGLQIAVHALGDAAVRRTLDGYEHVRRVNGIRDSRHRLEHIEIVHPDDLPRFAKLGVIAAMQPLHAPYQFPEKPAVFPGRVGPERWHRSFAWQYVRGAGARLVFGSDWPVVISDPMLGMHAALNRRAWSPGLSDHRQSLEDTIASYTREGAYAEFQEDRKGQIKTGMLADVVLLSADLLDTPDEEIKDVRPVLTICDGRIVFEA